ncbi:unnamed protein product, partial [Cuscuta epithymum]
MLLAKDLLSRTPIGAGEKCGGVYYFHSLDPVRVCSITKEERSDLWHSRLGHPSIKVLRSISSLNDASLSVGLNKNCDACLRGKKTRDIFHTSHSRAMEIFELI